MLKMKYITIINLIIHIMIYPRKPQYWRNPTNNSINTTIPWLKNRASQANPQLSLGIFLWLG